MQMVAASKMRRAQQAALAGRPYAALMNNVLAEVIHHAGDFKHPLMEQRDIKQRAVILITTDKGLCGSLNSNLLREAASYDPDSTVFIAAGRKGAQFLARTKRRLLAEFSYKDIPQFSEARAIAKFAIKLFLEDKADSVDILFTNFISTLVQRPEKRILLPVSKIKPVMAGVEGEESTEQFMKGAVEFMFEPSAEKVFEALLPHYLNYQVYQVLLEAKASEHSARMVAMKNATDNAQQLIKDLTLEYNKMRQSGITKELLEISTAVLAME
jgi:F-type H+-transporting ATPase subunit gamma